MYLEEEKREARAKKEEDRARKLEERRLRDEEKQKARNENIKSKGLIDSPQGTTGNKDALTEAEPPVLEPIPHVASIAPTDKVQAATEESNSPGDEKRMDPTFIPMSEMDEITASQANLGKVDTEESDLEPVVTAESELPPTGTLIGDAEAIARRVFSAPVENETASPSEPLASETKEIANSTSNIEEAPVVGAEVTEALNTDPASMSAPPLGLAPATGELGLAKRPDVPVTARIAPPVSAGTPDAATTVTTVSGPSTSPKAKESKGISSWLKTKFSRPRRTSKSLKSEPPTATATNKETGFVGGANLTAPEVSNPSSDHGGSSMRAVAMAGKDTTDIGPTDQATAPELSPVVSPNDEDLYAASTRSPKGTGAAQRQSTDSPSISSLSSDEDTRGRSAIPRDREPLSQKEFLQEELMKGEHVDPALIAGEQVDPALVGQGHGHGKGESSSGGGGEEFEEARDTFDSEKLSPPDKSMIGGGSRKSDSPARDSRFLEDL